MLNAFKHYQFIMGNLNYLHAIHGATNEKLDGVTNIIHRFIDNEKIFKLDNTTM